MAFAYRVAAIAVMAGLVAGVSAKADVITSTWGGGTGDWSNGANWSPGTQYPNNGNGGNNYQVVANGGTSTLTEDIVVDQADFSGHTMNGPHSLTALNAMTWSNATFGNSQLSSPASTSINYLNTLNGTAVELRGTTNWSDGAFIIGNNGASIANYGSFNAQSNQYYLWGEVGARPTFINFGTYTNLTRNTFQDVQFTNAGTVNLPWTLSVTGATTYNNTYTQIAGKTVLGSETGDGGLRVPGTMVVKAGRLEGWGVISGNLQNNGTIAPGFAGAGPYVPHTLYATGEAVLGDSSVLQIDLASATDYDQFYNAYGTDGGTLTLGGTLEVRLANGFENSISSTDVFTIAAWGGIAGSFANVAGGQRLLTADGKGSFLVDYGGIGDPCRVNLSDFQAVPEPTGAALVLGGVVPLLLRRRRGIVRS